MTGIKDVVITGLGAITPLGLTYKDTWQGICEGKSAIDTIKAFNPSGFTCKLAGEVADYKIKDYISKAQRKTTKLMSRDIEMAIIASIEAFADAGFISPNIDAENATIDPVRTGICLGAGLISCDLVELAPAVAKSITDGKFDMKKWGKEGLDAVTPIWLLKYLPNMLPCHVGINHNLQGPSNTITCAEAAAQIAIIEAAQIITRGDADVMLAGGGESKVNPMVMTRQCLNDRAIKNYNGQPEKSCRPFDANATGSVFGEAAANVVIETIESAKKRNAKTYAQIVGYGQSNCLSTDYRHLEPDGKGLQIAIEKAIKSAGIKPEDLDLIIPHGSAIPCDDTAEATAIAAAIGGAAEKIPCLPMKSMVSNTGAASGAIDVVIACCVMADGKIPAAINCEQKSARCNLNINTKQIEKEIKYVLCCSYTYGGQTAAIILKNTQDTL